MITTLSPEDVRMAAQRTERIKEDISAYRFIGIPEDQIKAAISGVTVSLKPMPRTSSTMTQSLRNPHRKRCEYGIIPNCLFLLLIPV